MSAQGFRLWGEEPSTSGDASLTTRVSTEESTRAAADTSLTTRVSTEESARAAADTSLTTRVSTEEVTRATADTSLTTRVSSEETVRASVDTSLLAGINAPAAFDLQAVGAITIDSSGGAIGVGGDANAFAINIGTGAAARTITVGNSTGATSVVLNAGTGNVDIGTTNFARATNIATAGAAQTVIVGSTDTTSSMTLRSGSGAFTNTAGGTYAVNGTGAVSINATAGAINVGDGTHAQAINIGTGAAARTVTMGNVTGTTSIVLNAGTGNIDVGTTAQARITNIATGAAAQVVTVGSTSGASSLTLDSGTVATLVRTAGATRASIGASAILFTQGAASGTPPIAVRSAVGALTSLTAATNLYDFEIDGTAASAQWTTGANVAEAFVARVRPRTYTATAATQTFDLVATLHVTGEPIAGANVVFNESYSLAIAGRSDFTASSAGSANGFATVQSRANLTSGNQSADAFGAGVFIANATGAAIVSGTAELTALTGAAQVNTTGTVALAIGAVGTAFAVGPGVRTVTELIGHDGEAGYDDDGGLPAAGSVITTVRVYRALPALNVVAGTRTIGTIIGFTAPNLGAAGITDAIGVDIDAQSGASGLNIGLRNAGSTTLTNALTQSGGNVSVTSQSGGTCVLGNTGAAASMTLDAGTGTVNAWTFAAARTVNIATPAAAIQTINIGTGASANIVTIGSTNGAASMTLDAGTGTVNAWAGAQARTVNLATGAAAQLVSLGSDTGASALTLQTGSVPIKFRVAATEQVNIDTQAANWFSGGAASLLTGTSGRDFAIESVAGGRLLLKSGTNQAFALNGGSLAFYNSSVQLGMTLTPGNTPSIVFPTTATTATIEATGSGILAIQTATGTMNIATTASIRAVNLATGGAAQTVTVGSTNSTSTLTLQAGTGGVDVTGDLRTNKWIGKGADGVAVTDTTLVSDATLTVSLVAGVKYGFRFRCFTINAGAAEGVKFALSGTATVTAMKAMITIFDDVLNTMVALSRVTALGSSVGAAMSTGDGFATVDGVIECNAAGTFVVQLAQNATGANAGVIMQRNSSMEIVRLT